MSDITYRPFESKDINALVELCDSAWSFSDYTNNESTRQALVRTDAYGALMGSTYITIAYENDKPAGVLIGQHKHFLNAFKKLKYRFLFWGNIFKLMFIHKDAKDALNNFRKIDRSYQKLYKKLTEKYQSEVVLFIVHPSMQGKGVGKNLMKQFINQCKEKNFKRFYLFTDTTCNYGFYDHFGFKHLASESINIALKSQDEILTSFIYEYTLTT